MNLVIANDARRRQAMGWEPARYKPRQRLWIEPGFNVLGRAFGLLTELFPWPIRRRLYVNLCQKMGGHAPEANPALPQVQQHCVSLAQELKRLTGQWPAFFVLTSHPETVGPLEWLRFEILRQGQMVANAVADAETPGALYRPHPQCFLAIDPYALDTVSPAVGGFYAGWMHQIFIAWDRQLSTQSWIQRHLLLRGTGYPRIGWRLLRALRKNPVLMVLSGGLPHNARLLYAAREYVQHLQLPRWPMPKRAVEKRLMEIVMEPVEGVQPTERGEIPPPTRAALAVFLKELGTSELQIEDLLHRFAERWKPAVPHRDRLFKVLLRLVRRGKPLMILPIGHRNQIPHVALAEPWAIYRDASGALQMTHAGRTEPFELSTFLKQIAPAFL